MIGRHLVLLLSVSFLLSGVGAGCTKPNPAVCCVDSADCAALGLPESSRCGDGEACLAHQCEDSGCEADLQCTSVATPFCEDRACVACRLNEAALSEGCTAETPVCDWQADACVGCTETDECAAYADTPACAPSGACVQCLTNDQCSNPTPVCSADFACTTCTSGDQCDSGVCDLETGACALSAQVVTLDTAGVGVACTPAAPCADVATAVDLLDETRPYLHLRPTAVGTPFDGPLELITRNNDILPRIQVYGAGATITSNVSIGQGDAYENSVLRVDGTEVVVWGLRIETASANTAVAGAHAVRVGDGADVTLHEASVIFTGTPGAVARANGVRAIDAASRVTLDRTTVEGFTNLLDVSDSGYAAVERSTLRNGTFGVNVASIGQAAIKNSLITLTSEPAIRAYGGRFTLTSSTLINTGYSTSTARFLDCEDVYLGAVALHAGNVAWNTLGNSNKPMIGGTDAALCPMSSSVLGPTGGGTPPGSNQVIGDPLLVDLPAGNYHLQTTSPAIDLYAGCDPEAGLLDFDGAPRPLGVGCDAGAFELQ